MRSLPTLDPYSFKSCKMRLFLSDFQTLFQKYFSRSSDFLLEVLCLFLASISVVLRGKTRKNVLLWKHDATEWIFMAESLFWLFQNALMTFEEEKMAKSLTTLRAMEKRCSSNLSWSPSFSSFQSMKSRIWGVGSQSQSTPTTVSKWAWKNSSSNERRDIFPLASL